MGLDKCRGNGANIMIKKFTQMQYDQIVAISEDNAEDREEKTKQILYYIFDNKLMPGGRTEILDRALVISNPLTREIGRERYVEAEKRYIFTSKNDPRYSLVISEDSGMIIPWAYRHTALTTKEVLESGMYDLSGWTTKEVKEK